MWAQIAASRKAASRVAQIATAHGIATYLDAIESLFSEGEARARAGLAALPKGRFAVEEEQDDGAIWCAEIVTADDSFTVDLRGNQAQRAAPYNTSRDGAVISAQMIFKALSDPELFANAGSFAPLRVLTEPGTIFHALEPAPHGYYFETRIRLYDMLWRCMASAMTERLPAGHFADGFVIPSPTKNIDAYTKIAKKAAKVWMDHGALSYYESVGEDVVVSFGRPFPKLAKGKPDETVIFAWITYKTRAHRDKVNANVMADERLAGMDKNLPFDMKRMSCGGFKIIVSG